MEKQNKIQTLVFTGSKIERAYAKAIIYLSGCAIFSIGATFFILSHLGTDPLDVLSVGVKDTFGLLIGTTQSLFAVMCLVIWSALHKYKFPPLSTFLTFFICGYLIDGCLWLTDNTSIFNPYAEMILGVVLCTISSSLIIMSGFGIRAMDLLAITFTERTSLPFWFYKGISEALLLISGWLLGGVVGVGTIAFLLGVGWLIQPTIRLLYKLGIPNFSSVK
jgi:uncharacterized protein